MNVRLIAAAFAVLASVQAADAATPQLKFANPGPPKGYVAVTFTDPWIERVNKAADGALEFKLFAGPGLGTYQNIYDRTINGVADAAFGLLGPISSQFPRTTVPAMPFVTPNATIGSLALWKLLGDGILGGEWDHVKPLALMVFPNVVIHSRKPIAKLEDVQGLKISAQSRPVGEGIERLGAAPVTMPVSELYQSLQRGTIDAATIGWPAHAAYKLGEVTSYHVNVPLGSEVTFMVMNKDSYAKLPAKGRAAIDHEIGEGFQRFIGNSLDELDEKETKDTAAKPGQSVISLPPQEAERWKGRTQPVTESWIKSTPDGAKVLAAYRAAIDSIGGKH
jgi:TRAP-type C4-dicarboxylate transport system substrate-binding protein